MLIRYGSLCLPAPGDGPRDVELVNARYDDRRQELVTLDKGRARRLGRKRAGAMTASGLAWYATRGSRSAITGGARRLAHALGYLFSTSSPR